MGRRPESLTNDQKTILVVDDDRVTLELVSETLLGDNYSVLTASSAEGAVRLARDYKSKIHLLLSDFQMTGMTGIDLATRLSLERPQLKVLIVSAFGAELLVLNKGWYFLSKPFVPSQLRTLVAGLVSSDREAGFSEVPAREGESEGQIIPRIESDWNSL